MTDPYTGWAGLYNPLAEPWLRPLKRRIVRRCAEAGLSRVLEVGSGTGTLCGLPAKDGMVAGGSTTAAEQNLLHYRPICVSSLQCSLSRWIPVRNFMRS